MQSTAVSDTAAPLESPCAVEVVIVSVPVSTAEIVNAVPVLGAMLKFFICVRPEPQSFAGS
jgi:hypothetical protein